ncbi:hypothetical protein ACXYS0_26800, partial [Escherichia coli]
MALDPLDYRCNLALAMLEYNRADFPFNMSNQRNGDQREALFNAIAAYASNIENLPALLP